MHQNLLVDLVDVVRLVRLKYQLIECVYKLVLGLHLSVKLLKLSLRLHGIFPLIF